tara:strand:+ start:1280 stop:1585 length:306 start_codon:yes stop_codon:yes gene_type:complete
MAYTVTEDMTYSGTGYDVTVLTPLEMFQLYKTEHSVPEETTTSFNNATGLTSFDVTKPSDSVVRHVSIWEDKASYDAWRDAHPRVTPGADWAHNEVSKEES